MTMQFDEWHQIPDTDLWVKASPNFRGTVKFQFNGSDIIFVQSKRRGLWGRIVNAWIYR